MNTRKIKVLVVEDSSVVQALLVRLLDSDERFEVIGTAKNGRDALEFMSRKSPDVILMDIQMPEMDGFEATRRIMETSPVPIVICSGSTDPRETMTVFRSMEAGAVACIEKPVGQEHRNFDVTAAHLLQTVKLMSEVKVVRRWSHSRRSAVAPEATGSSSLPSMLTARTELIGIGASTGGPPVLQTILTSLPKDFAVPILIVQHIAAGFLPGLVEWLNQTTGVKVHIAAYGIQPLPGHVYLAPDDFHLGVRMGGQLTLTKEEADRGLRPAVSHLFASLTHSCGSAAMGVLLTGMGRDGAEELKRMKDRGAITIAQDRESSIVHGMPGAAIALGAATHILPADKIGPAIVTIINQQRMARGGAS